MKKQLLLLILLLFFLKGFAQIGINTTTPNAMLDVISSTNGVLFPRIALTANNVAAPVVNPQGGALATATLIYNTATVAGINGVLPGYYYWNGSQWVTFSSSIDWKLNGNASITTPAFPITYGTSTIGASENFIGTTDENDVVFGSNAIERMRIRGATGFIGVGTANPAYKLHVTKDTAGSITTYSENTFVGNTNGTAIYGSAFNNPGYGIGGQFAGGSRGVIAQANGSTSTFTVTGVLASATGSGNGFREGGNFSASGVNITNKGIVSDANGATTSNYGGLFSASGGIESYGGLFSASGGTSNYGGYFSVISPATTNYAGYFSASTGTKNYAIVVPSTGGTVGFGTITPNALLDVSSSTNGVLFPRIALTANNVAAPVVNPQGGALPTSTLIYNTATVAGVNGVAPGYYYWNGSLWIPFLSPISNDWKLNGNTASNDPATPPIYGTSTIGAAENFIGTTDANDVVIGTNNIERFRVKQTTGNVGIGTATPASKLDLNGDLALREGAAINVITGANALTLTGKYSHYRLTGAAGDFSINSISAGTDGQVITLINTASNVVMTISNNSGASANSILTGTGSNLVTIGQNNMFPSVSLIYNTSLARWIVTSSSGLRSPNNWDIYGNSTVTTPSVPGTYGTSTILPTENFIGTTSANDVVVGTNNIERLRVKQTSGNVGIGTANPVSKLDLGGDLALREGTAITVAAGINNITLPGKFSHYRLIGATGAFSINTIASGNNGQMLTLINTTSNVMTINNNFGTDGIMTGTGAAIVIPGVINSSVTFIYNPIIGLWIVTSNSGMNFSNDWKLNGNTAITTPAIPSTYGTSTISAAENFIGTKDANDVVIGTNNIERLRIDKSTGNVGIGTANPLAKLDVLSNGANAIYSKSLSGRGGYFEGFNQGIHSQGLMGIEALGFSTDLMVPSGANFSAWGSGLAGSKGYGLQSAAFSSETNYGGYFTATGGTNNYAIIVPSNSGDVGIGTITPTYKLHVANSVSNAPTAYFENGSNSGLGIEGIATGLFGGTGGRFTGSTVGVRGIGVSSLGATTIYGGIFSANTLSSDSYGVQASASGAVNVNYAGYFTATGTNTNVAGYFSSSNGATVYNNKAIIVPPNGGLVGIGTNNPVDQLEVAGGYVRSTGYRCRTGISGTYPGNVFNINWNGSSSQLWIDATNVGTFQFTSDRRLKENIFKMDDDALSRVMRLKPVSFNYKNIPNTIFTGSDVVTEGFIADELQEVIPSAVNGDKNAVTSDGTIQPQTINTAPIVSVLTKAIQEQQQIIDDLKAKNNQLEVRLKAIEDKLGK